MSEHKSIIGLYYPVYILAILGSMLLYQMVNTIAGPVFLISGTILISIFMYPYPSPAKDYFITIAWVLWIAQVVLTYYFDNHVGNILFIQAWVIILTFAAIGEVLINFNKKTLHS